MAKYRFRALLAAATLAAAPYTVSAADNYPERPIHLIIGFSAGGPTDVIARVVAKDLTGSLGQSVVVENKPGANSMIGTEYVARADADGYTLLGSTLAHNVNAILASNLIKYDPFKDFTPVTLLATVPMIAVTAYDSPYKSLQDVIDKAKQDPGSVTYGSAGNGGSAHLAGAYLATSTGTEMTHVPFKGNGPALTEVMAGRLDFMFYPTIGVADLEASKRVRALAITTAERHPDFPNLPTTEEAGFKGFDEYSPGIGIVTPAGTPEAVVNKLHDAITKSLANTETAEQLRRLGAVHAGLGPTEFGEWLRNDYERWERVIKAANISAE